MAADTLLVAADKIHSNEPFDEWQLSVFKDCTNETRKVLSTSLTAKFTIFASHTVMPPTIRTNNVLLVTNAPTTLNDGLLAYIIGSEV